jgi:hypothetical protein
MKNILHPDFLKFMHEFPCSKPRYKSDSGKEFDYLTAFGLVFTNQ